MDPFAPLAPPPPPQPQPLPQVQPPPPSSFDPPPPTTTAFPPVLQPAAYVINPTLNFAPPPPAPAAAAAAPPHHPPYAQMISEAITALNDKTGSSKSAIARYIDRVYSNLPGTHSALLSHHLKRLKESGQLVMIKHSYKLPGSAPPPPQIQLQANGPKRRPGRPPKAIPAAQIQPPPVNVTAGLGLVTVPESVFASLGLVDTPVEEIKRRPGRPRKAKSEAAGGVGVGIQQQPTPTAVAAVKKRPGRPAKNAASNAASPASAVGRPRGRPAKNSVYTGKPRGRQPKKAVAASGPVGGEVAAAPALVLATTGYVADAATVTVPTTAPADPTLKRRGRPAAAGGGPKRPRKLSGKPLGRPKKIGPAAPAPVSNLQQLMAYQELRSKLEFFQSRIKQTVGVLRPCLDGQSTANAVAALQELEELAAIDVTAPLNLQNRQPPPPENQA